MSVIFEDCADCAPEACNGHGLDALTAAERTERPCPSNANERIEYRVVEGPSAPSPRNRLLEMETAMREAADVLSGTKPHGMAYEDRVTRAFEILTGELVAQRLTLGAASPPSSTPPRECAGRVPVFRLGMLGQNVASNETRRCRFEPLAGSDLCEGCQMRAASRTPERADG